jgi:2-polyprenyl-6-methoxyphenol hydroxylase-like FAD-dependent oxidoreductase
VCQYETVRGKLDIGIAGCGVAGLAAAALLARAGHRVVVFDKLEAPAPLGSGLILQPVGLAALDAIGAGEAIRALGARIERLYGRTQPSGRVVLDVRYGARGANAARGLAVHRGALFQVLLDAAVAAGAAMQHGRDIAAADDGAFVFANGARSARFDLAVDALGMRSPLSGAPARLLAFGALWANIDWPADGPFDAHALEQRYERARKMAGVLPIGRLAPGGRAQAALFWSLKGEAYEAWRARGLGAWREEIAALWPEAAPLFARVAAEDLVFARYAHRTRRSPLSRGLVHVGDSWHCASPQLGQGANMAMLDALALAQALEARAALADALALYQRLRLWHIRLYQLASWMFTPAYQSDSALLAFIRDWLMAPLARIPPVPTLLAALVAGELGAPLGAIGRATSASKPFLSPGRRGGWP